MRVRWWNSGTRTTSGASSGPESLAPTGTASYTSAGGRMFGSDGEAEATGCQLGLDLGGPVLSCSASV
jgi:hypothetical protein